MTLPQRIANIADRVDAMALERPEQPAVVKLGAGGGRLTFAELTAESNRCAGGLQWAGITAGMRVLVLIRPGPQFSAVIFGLLKLGALPVLIDPGMGVRAFVACVRQVRPQGLIGVPAAHLVRRWYAEAFATLQVSVTVGRRWAWSGQTLDQVRARGACEFETRPTAPEDSAAILFTSGSTGPAKGVVYEHGMFAAQVRSIQSHYGLQPGEVELATFPLFALFCPLMGLTCVLPDMDFSRPGQVDAERVVRAARDGRATNAFGSPALWRRVAAYCGRRGIVLDSLRRVLIAGAPVDWRILQAVKSCLPESAEVFTPYGATEALPVSSVSATELLGDCVEQTRRGAGICVGPPLPQRSVRIIAISDEPIATWSEVKCLEAGRIGEIVVSGAVVTRGYYDLPAATAAAKIADGPRVWHRMGDAGYLDARGRLWYCGRKAQRVETAAGPSYSECCEGVFCSHPDVLRCALVGLGPAGRQEPIMVVEPVAGRAGSRRRQAQLVEELRDIGRRQATTAAIRRFLFRGRFPVDTRHNAKIDREALADWARRQAR